MPRHMCETPKKRQTSKTGVLVSINLSLNRWGNIYRADTSGWKWALCAGGVKTLTRLVRLEGWVIKKKRHFQSTLRNAFIRRGTYTVCVCRRKKQFGEAEGSELGFTLACGVWNDWRWSGYAREAAESPGLEHWGGEEGLALLTQPQAADHRPGNRTIMRGYAEGATACLQGCPQFGNKQN